MEPKKKYDVLIYPDFSLQEITCLTSCWPEEDYQEFLQDLKEFTDKD